MRRVLPLLFLVPMAAQAVPDVLSHQGRLFDQTGVPLDGTHDLSFGLHDAPVAGAEIWAEDLVGVGFVDGYFSVDLAGIDGTVASGDDMWLSIAVDGGSPLATRIAVRSVPYAVRAGTVDWADVAGVPADLQDGGDADTLATLLCTSGQIAVFNGTWDCGDLPSTATVDGGAITGTVPATALPIGTGSSDVAAGDHLHTPSDLTGIVPTANLPIGTGSANVAAGDHGHVINDVSGTVPLNQLPVGTGSGNVAAGDHGHDISAISGPVPFASLPVGSGGSQVAAGNHTHAAGDITSGTVALARLPMGTSGTTAAYGDHSHTESWQIPNDTSSCVSSSNAGTMRYSAGVIEVCGENDAWVIVVDTALGTLPSRPGETCEDILTRAPGSPDGQYWIDPNGGATSDSFLVTCDMSGGGYTRLNLHGGRTMANLSIGAQSDCSPYDGYGTNSYPGSGHRASCGGTENPVTWNDDNANAIPTSQVTAMYNLNMVSTPVQNWIQDPDGTTDNLLFCWGTSTLANHTWAPKSGTSMSCYQDNNAVTTRIFDKWSGSCCGDDNAQNWYLERYWFFR